jgi:hypothetical protein
MKTKVLGILALMGVAAVAGVGAVGASAFQSNVGASATTKRMLLDGTHNKVSTTNTFVNCTTMIGGSPSTTGASVAVGPYFNGSGVTYTFTNTSYYAVANANTASSGIYSGSMTFYFYAKNITSFAAQFSASNGTVPTAKVRYTSNGTPTTDPISGTGVDAVSGTTYSPTGCNGLQLSFYVTSSAAFELYLKQVIVYWAC